MLHNVMLVKQIQRLQHSLTVFVVATIQPHQHPKGFLTSKPCAIWCSLILSAQFTWLGIMFCRFDLHIYIHLWRAKQVFHPVHGPSDPSRACWTCEFPAAQNKQWWRPSLSLFGRLFFLRWVGGSVLASMPGAQEALRRRWFPPQIVFILSIQAGKHQSSTCIIGNFRDGVVAGHFASGLVLMNFWFMILALYTSCWWRCMIWFPFFWRIRPSRHLWKCYARGNYPNMAWPWTRLMALIPDRKLQICNTKWASRCCCMTHCDMLHHNFLLLYLLGTPIRDTQWIELGGQFRGNGRIFIM